MVNSPMTFSSVLARVAQPQEIDDRRDVIVVKAFSCTGKPERLKSIAQLLDAKCILATCIRCYCCVVNCIFFSVWFWFFFICEIESWWFRVLFLFVARLKVRCVFCTLFFYGSFCWLNMWVIRKNLISVYGENKYDDVFWLSVRKHDILKWNVLKFRLVSVFICE